MLWRAFAYIALQACAMLISLVYSFVAAAQTSDLKHNRCIFGVTDTRVHTHVEPSSYGFETQSRHALFDCLLARLVSCVYDFGTIGIVRHNFGTIGIVRYNFGTNRAL